MGLLTPEQEAQWLAEVEKAFGVHFGRHENLNVFCPFHDDAESPSQSKSCSVSTTGLFSCKTCGASGNHLKFYAQRTGHKRPDQTLQAALALEVTDADRREASSGLTARVQRSTVPVRPLGEDNVAKQQQMLAENEKWTKYLREERGLTWATVQRFRIGCDEDRITIPVFGSTGSLVNIRRYLPHAASRGMPKMVSSTRGDGTPTLYPWWAFDEVEFGGTIVVCEGEWDCMLLWQNGIPAVTNTGNCKVWDAEWTQHLVRYNLVFMYDVNDKFVPGEGKDKLGQRMMRLRATELLAAGALSVKVVDLPLPEKYVGGDVTNWFVDEKRTKEDLQQLINDTPFWNASMDMATTDGAPALAAVDLNPQSTAPGTTKPAASTQGSHRTVIPGRGWDQIPLVTLSEAADARFFYSDLRVRCLVAGRGVAPYLVPKRFTGEARVESGPSETRTVELQPNDGRLLALLNCTTRTQKTLLKTILGWGNDDQVTIEAHESYNVEELFLIPTIEYDRDQGPYTLRRAFYVGRGLETNRVYELSGYTLPDPATQQATHLFLQARPAESNIDSFTINKEQKNELARLFQTENIHNRFADIAKQFADHVTHIHGRADLHTAVDLVFHSPLAFDFEGVRVRKGWLEALIIGDTRTGKGFVTEGLARHYGVGEVVSGENLSMAGIVGGVQHVGDRWTLVWGKIPLADKRLIIMDECGSLSHSDIGRLSRIRSEGVAEITKVISEKTTARTRLIWLANPRPTPGATVPRSVADYNHGIEAVPELIGAAEDVARFDFALVVARDEVAPAIINAAHEVTQELTYDTLSCRTLVLWAWSRRPEHIVFEPGVSDLILRAAKALGGQFSSKICLIQSEDVRFKLARIACAAAARVFSTVDGEHLIVKNTHVEFAYNFLYHIYSKASCGYLAYSAAEREKSVLRNPEEVKAALSVAGDRVLELVDALADNRVFTINDISDAADLEYSSARTIIAELVRARAVSKENHGYVKRPAFRTFLATLKSEMGRNKGIQEHETEADAEGESDNDSIPSTPAQEQPQGSSNG